VYNVDETGITTVHSPTKRLGPKEVKQFGAKTSSERGKNVTAIFCCNATGQFVAPMFIFPRKRMTTALQKNGPLGAIYSCSPTG
ncbi:DDE 1 domain containing protein, partial [Asbolus verrucosus]